MPASPPPPQPTPTPRPGVIPRLRLPLLLNNYLTIDGRPAQIVKFYLVGGQRIASRAGSTGAVTYYYHDHLGSTVGSSAGESTRYYPFGATRSGNISTPYQFTGQRREAALGLYFYQARWYDSAIGRFLQPDTIVPQPGDPQSLNRYSYTRNNPLRYTDPTGHDIQDFLDTFSEVAGGLVAQVAYVNSLQAVSALATQPNESDAATFGRHLGNVVALAQGVEEMVGGVGLIGGGAAACGTGVLCLAGAPAVVAGSAVAAHGVGVAGIAAAQEGQMLGNLVLQRRMN